MNNFNLNKLISSRILGSNISQAFKFNTPKFRRIPSGDAAVSGELFRREEQRMESKLDGVVEEGETRKVEFDASEIEYVSYGGEHHLPLIMNLVDQELSEPYSIFTYRYFVYLWPQLSFLVSISLLSNLWRIRSWLSPFPLIFVPLFLFLLFPQAFHRGKCVGTVVCKMGEHRGTFRGYIAMLVVIKPYRGKGIGKFCSLWFLWRNCCLPVFESGSFSVMCDQWNLWFSFICKMDLSMAPFFCCCNVFWKTHLYYLPRFGCY